MNTSDVEFYFYLSSNVEEREYIFLYNNRKKKYFYVNFCKFALIFFRLN